VDASLDVERPEKIKGYSMNVELELISEGIFLVSRPTMNVDVNVSGETDTNNIRKGIHFKSDSVCKMSLFSG